MSSMLKKKSGFKPKAPIRRNAPVASPATSASPATTELQSKGASPSVPPAIPAHSGQALPAPTLPSPPAVESQAPNEQPILVASPQPDKRINSIAQSSSLDAINKLGASSDEKDNAARSVTAPDPTVRVGHTREEQSLQPTVTPAAQLEEPSATTDSIHLPALVVEAPTTATTSAALGATSLISPVSTIPSISSLARVDPGLISQSDAPVNDQVTAAEQQIPLPTSSSGPPLSPPPSVTRDTGVQEQSLEFATPSGESTQDHDPATGAIGEASGVEHSASTSSQPAKRAPKRKAANGSASQPRKRTRKPAATEGETEGGGEPARPKPRRKPRVENSEAGEGEATAQPKARKRREVVGESREPRKRREPTPEDAESQKVDITKVKMADLVKDLRIGKKFSLHDQLVQQERDQRQKYIDARKQRVNGEAQVNGEGDIQQAGDAAVSGAHGDSAGAPDSDTPGASLAAAGPQFQIVDGQIVLDASSLQVDRHARAAGHSQEAVEENEFTRKITSSTYLRRKRKPKQWTEEETDEFYRLLRMFGTDFETISRMMPGKDRSNVIGKYRREDRNNPARVTETLTGPKTSTINVAEYERLAGEKLESTESIEAERKAAEDEFEAEEKRREDEAAEEARKKREALYGKDDDAGTADAESSKKTKTGRGKKAKAKPTGGMW